jgi:hypothetical protein
MSGAFRARGVGALKLRSAAKVIYITATTWPTVANYKGRFEMRNGMTEWNPARYGLLLRTGESALAFFATGGSERPFRGGCHISLHLRDSGNPQARLPLTSFRSIRIARELRAYSGRTLKRNLTVAKANEPSAPDQQTPQL